MFFGSILAGSATQVLLLDHREAPLGWVTGKFPTHLGKLFMAMDLTMSGRWFGTFFIFPYWE